MNAFTTLEYQAVEIEWPSGTQLWSYAYPDNGLRTARDADRLPNGNTLIQGVLTDGGESAILEVTPSGEIVWRLKLINASAKLSPGFFYKAQSV